MFPSSHHSLFLVILLAVTGSSFMSLMVHSLATTPTLAPLRFFIGGLGYCGNRLADRLRLEFPDCHISGCVRSEASKRSLLAATTKAAHNNKLAIHVLDLDQEYQGLDEAGLEDLTRATHIVQTIAPIADFDRDPLLALHSQTLLASSSSSSSSCLQWVGYLSSTGVYGDYYGDWVDEDSDLKCQDAKSLARVQAEKEWRDFETKMRQQERRVVPPLRVDCFRCGGIYGPGRGPLATALARLEAGTLSIPEEETSNIDESSSEPPKYVNRILVDDICGAIVAAVKANNAVITVSAQSPSTSIPAVGGIYNLVDDDPAPRRHVVAEANRLVRSTFPNKTKRLTPSSSSSLAASSPPPIQSSLKRPTSRNTGNKRCKNQRLKDAFHWKLLAPTFREGLRICLESYDDVKK